MAVAAVLLVCRCSCWPLFTPTPAACRSKRALIHPPSPCLTRRDEERLAQRALDGALLALCRVGRRFMFLLSSRLSFVVAVAARVCVCVTERGDRAEKRQQTSKQRAKQPPPPNTQRPRALTLDSARATRVTVSRMTGPPAPCALSEPTSSWSNSATARTAGSSASAPAPPTDSQSAWVRSVVCVVGEWWLIWGPGLQSSHRIPALPPSHHMRPPPHGALPTHKHRAQPTHNTTTTTTTDSNNSTPRPPPSTTRGCRGAPRTQTPRRRRRAPPAACRTG